MKAIKIFCLEKRRDRSGLITEYVVRSKNGETQVLDRTGVVKLLKDKKYNVVNLQLDKLGRVIDKEIETNAIYDEALEFIQKRGLIIIARNTKGEVKLTKPFNRLEKDTDIEELQLEFEQYIREKHGITLTKLRVENTTNNRMFIQYGLQYVEYNLLSNYSINDDGQRNITFRDIESIQNYRISCTASPKTHKCYKKIVPFKDKQGRVIKDAFLGIIVCDRCSPQAIEWSNKRVKELEDKIASMK
ncbi:MAG: hypothetical protein IKK18_00800 [Clostridia bacterium]|nr:hypothetical protein [Clostridia bacterium]